MNKQFLAILGVLVVVIGGTALLVFRQGASEKPAVAAQLGQPLLRGLKASEVASIAIREPKATLTLVKKETAGRSRKRTASPPISTRSPTWW